MDQFISQNQHIIAIFIILIGSGLFGVLITIAGLLEAMRKFVDIKRKMDEERLDEAIRLFVR